MNCDDAAEFVSALCDNETIPPAAAEHIKTCAVCHARLSEYIAMGVELRCAASLETSAGVPHREWAKPRTRLAAWWRRGWETMRIPRVAFAVLIAGILVLASTLAVVKVRANNTGTVVLLSTVGPNGRLPDCPLSTQDAKQACDSYVRIGSQFLAYRVRLLSRQGARVQLAIRTRIYSAGQDLSSFTQDADPATKVTEVWFEPGEPLKVDVPDVGALTLTGEWMDHMPIFTSMKGQDLSPGPGELRFASPLLLKDKTVAGDLVGAVSGIFGTDNPASAVWIYLPGQGSFLLSLLPMKGAVEAHVTFSRISFKEGGHSWEFVTGAPVSRADHLWVLHQPDFKVNATGQNGDTSFIGALPLVQTGSGEWIPSVRQ